MHWECQACGHATPPATLPFAHHGELPSTGLYCVICGMTQMHRARPSERRLPTIGEVLAVVDGEESFVGG